MGQIALSTILGRPIKLTAIKIDANAFNMLVLVDGILSLIETLFDVDTQDADCCGFLFLVFLYFWQLLSSLISAQITRELMAFNDTRSTEFHFWHFNLFGESSQHDESGNEVFWMENLRNFLRGKAREDFQSLKSPAKTGSMIGGKSHEIVFLAPVGEKAAQVQNSNHSVQQNQKSWFLQRLRSSIQSLRCAWLR